MHKRRQLFKPMVVVTTTGYIVSVLGPYFSDGKNNDASILNHFLKNNMEDIRTCVIFFDRSYKDLKEKQLTTGYAKKLGL